MALVILHCFADSGHPDATVARLMDEVPPASSHMTSRGGDILWHAWSFIGA
jgi:hypothetical protein